MVDHKNCFYLILGILIIYFFTLRRNGGEYYNNPYEYDETRQNELRGMQHFKMGKNATEMIEETYPNYKNAFSTKLYGFYGSLCNNPFTKRYMWNAVPPGRKVNGPRSGFNDSPLDLRDEPYFQPPPNKNFGIFSHTDIFGNYRDQRICPKRDKVYAKK